MQSVLSSFRFISFLLSFSLLVFFSDQVQAQESPTPTIICGEVAAAEASDKGPIISGQANPIAGQFKKQIPIREDGSFRFELNTPINIPLTLEYEKRNIELLVAPGDSVFISINPKSRKWDAFTIISGDPESASVNDYLLKRRYLFKGSKKMFSDNTMIRNAKGEEYKVFADSLRQAKQDYLDEHAKAKPMRAEFKQWMADEIDFDYAYNMIGYPYLYARYNNRKAADGTPVKVELPDDFFAALKDIPVEKEEYLLMKGYQKYLQQYLADRFHKEVIQAVEDYDYTNSYADKVKFTSEQISGKCSQYLQTMMFIEGSSKGQVDAIMPLLAEFRETCQNPEYKNIATQLYAQLLPLSKGQPAPDFVMTDRDGNTKHLSDYRGKVVYLDFWATWCGPCRKEMPFSQSLHEQLKDKEDEVVFLYVSFDRSEAPWQKFLTEKQPVGEHALVLGEAQKAVKKAYNISGIPKFLLIDQEGNIASSHARRPSDPKMKGDILKLLD